MTAVGPLNQYKWAVASIPVKSNKETVSLQYWFSYDIAALSAFARWFEINYDIYLWWAIRISGQSKFRCNVFFACFSLCVKSLNIIFKTVNGHFIVRELGIDTIFLIYCFE